MPATPEWLKQRIIAYYQATNERSYLPHWSGEALSYHCGLADENTKSLDEAHVNANKWLADHLAIGEDTRVLDAGCGVGGTSIWLAKERRARVVGVTLDPNQVAFATKFAADRGVSDRTTFHAMDYTATTFEPESFDVVFNLESVCHCFDVPAYFAHAFRLLKPGGRYACMECFRSDASNGTEQVLRELNDGWALAGLLTQGEIARALAGAGFGDIRHVNLTEEVKRPAAQLKAVASNGLMMARLQEAIDGKDDEIYRGHARGAIVVGDGIDSGLITYGVVSGRKPT